MMEGITIGSRQMSPWTLDCMETEYAKGASSPCSQVAQHRMVHGRPPIVWGNLSAPLMFVGLNPHYEPREQHCSAELGSKQREPVFFNLHNHIMSELSGRYGLSGTQVLRRKYDSIEAELVGCGSPDENDVNDDIRSICANRFLLPAIEAIRPKVIIGLGRFVVGWFCGRFGLTGFEDRISQEVGKQWIIPMCNTSAVFVACSHPNWRRYKPLQGVVDVIAHNCTVDDFLAARSNSNYFYFSPHS